MSNSKRILLLLLCRIVIKLVYGNWKIVYFELHMTRPLAIKMFYIPDDALLSFLQCLIFAYTN